MSKEADIEIDKLVITAKGTAFAEFAVEVCRLMGLLNDKEQLKSTLMFCKGISSH